MRRYLPAFLLALLALAPFTLTGCGELIAKLKGESADAASDAAVVTATATATPDAEVAPVPTETAAIDAGLVPTPATAATLRPVVAGDAGLKTDAGAKLDASAPIVDAGAAKDAGVRPTPTLNLPNLFDAGGFKPPWQK